MKRNEEKNLEKLVKLIEDLKNSSEKIIVEGKRDRKALEEIGIASERIFEISRVDIGKLGPTLNGKAIDLIDKDRKGIEISRRLHEKTKLTLNKKYKIIFSLIKSYHLEDLDNFLKKYIELKS